MFPVCAPPAPDLHCLWRHPRWVLGGQKVPGRRVAVSKERNYWRRKFLSQYSQAGDGRSSWVSLTAIVAEDNTGFIHGP